MIYYSPWRALGIAISNLLTPYSSWQHFQALQKSQYLPQKDLRRQQFKRLQRLYEHACRETPYYSYLKRQGRIPDQLRSLRDLEKLPLMTKELIISTEPPCNVSRTFLTNRHWILEGTTSGTTGKPFRFFHDLRKQSNLKLQHIRGLNLIGHRFGEPYAVFSVISANKLNIFYRRIEHKRFNRILLPCNILSPSALQKYLALMKKKHIQYLEGYVSAIFALAKYVMDSQTDFQLSAVKTVGETLFTNTRRFFEDSLYTEVFESYGSQEFGEIALECKEHIGAHIYDESFIVEVLREGEPVIGEEGDIAITDLTNYAQPFIRYLIGDRGVLSDELCSCGRTLSVLHSLKGRANDTILSPSGIWLSYFGTYFEPFKEVIQWQVEQVTKHQLLVRMVVSKNIPSLEPHIRSVLNQIDPAFEISFKYVEKIPKTPAGKFKTVISRYNLRMDLQNPTGKKRS